MVLSFDFSICLLGLNFCLCLLFGKRLFEFLVGSCQLVGPLFNVLLKLVDVLFQFVFCLGLFGYLMFELLICRR
ncbi:hypothetical protein ES703_92695 [subsurface metagenome]